MSDLLTGIFSTMGSGPKLYTGVRGFQRLSSNSKDNSPDATNTSSENETTQKSTKKKTRKKDFFGREKKTIKIILGDLCDIDDETIQVYSAEEVEKKEQQQEIQKEQEKKEEETKKNMKNLLENAPSTNPPIRTPEGDITLNDDGTKTLSRSDGSQVITDKDGNQQTIDSDGTSVQLDSKGSVSKTQPPKSTYISSNYEFSSDIKEEDKTNIKGIIDSANKLLRLKDLGLFDQEEDEILTNSVQINEYKIQDGEEQLQNTTTIMVPKPIEDIESLEDMA